MNTTKLTILGAGSAMPTKRHFPTSQFFEIRNKQFLIDCGEGAQIRMRQMGLKNNRLGHIFISHLHGDHCFGLIGLISTFGMLGHTQDIHIHSHPDLQQILQPQIDFFCRELPFRVIFLPFALNHSELIYEDRSLTVRTIPLSHRIPTAGFLFEEKERERNIKREMIDFYQIPISKIHQIKRGADFVNADNETVPNHRLTIAPAPPFRYAYCSDTTYHESIIPLIEGVDCLYHEATFAQSELARAKSTFHTTAIQAATIAHRANVKQLIIGHFSARYRNTQPLLEEAKTVFKNTYLAEDKRVFQW